MKNELVFFAYKGRSMNFTFRNGDILVVNKNNIPPVQGDVIVFRKGNRHICHRIIKVTLSGFLTRGDFNLENDHGKVQIAGIAGKVKRVFRKGRMFTSYSNTTGYNWMQLIQFIRYSLFALSRLFSVTSWVFERLPLIKNIYSRKNAKFFLKKILYRKW